MALSRMAFVKCSYSVVLSDEGHDKDVVLDTGFIENPGGYSCLSMDLRGIYCSLKTRIYILGDLCCMVCWLQQFGNTDTELRATAHEFNYSIFMVLRMFIYSKTSNVINWVLQLAQALQ